MGAKVAERRRCDGRGGGGHGAASAANPVWLHEALAPEPLVTFTRRALSLRARQPPVFGGLTEIPLQDFARTASAMAATREIASIAIIE